ncbi:hypothetical protein ACIA5D_36665 [Actinoplanes sp. NPDC051513]|uniref:hypothetical protein n=1 Tax=Actinoplanes sp. NPDC051513 TaxID=3363908 RepID=UPI0037B2D16D
MTAPTNLDRDVIPLPNGWRVHRDDGTSRTVLPRLSGEGWAVFDGASTSTDRTPRLGYPGSWRQDPAQAIEWARTVTS